VLSQVADDGRPVIVRQNGEDVAAVIPVFLTSMRNGYNPGRRKP
jgi:hypothetical protein